MSKDYFKYLSQELDNNLLDLVKQRGFYAYEYMSEFEKFKEELRSKEEFYSLLTGKLNMFLRLIKHVLKVWNKSEMKTIEDCHNLNLKSDVFRIISKGIMDYV